MSESHEHGITVTIKYGKGYEDTWAVFRGPSEVVRKQIIDYFGFECEPVTSLTLSELVVEATSIAHGTGNIAGLLGGRIVATEAPSDEDDPWAAASATPAPAAKEEPNGWILGEIAKQTSVADLQKVWAANQSFFADPTVMTAYKAKGRALKQVA
ncbi:hypothetical protein GCM10010211_00380 [Streptomyces albospinus]|uniref:Uncharacterized protein n=1 Tax=Streptomyces albospinus TaxID=285515 RepID=A0ABQ2UJU1_9ACTN|nr:hypothetical protein [Streptomyces albospinus]GGU41346.1 hypothetical protein GCM10010211_00380 [Streptomyces albospinus]